MTALQKLTSASFVSTDQAAKAETLAKQWVDDRDKARKTLKAIGSRPARAVRNLAVYNRMPGWYRRQRVGTLRPGDQRRVTALREGLEALR